MRIAYISGYNPSNQIARSGVPYSIYQQLKKKFEVDWISLRPVGIYKLMYPSFQFFIRILDKLGLIDSNRNRVTCKIQSLIIEKKIKDKKYDAIFSLGTLEVAYLRTKIPIYIRTDAIFNSFIDYYVFNYPRLKQREAFLMEKIALKNITLIFSPSQWLINEIRHYYPFFETSRMPLVESGANLNNNSVHYPNREYGLDKPLDMIFIGYDIKRKGIDIALSTLDILVDEYHLNATLSIIGGKPDEAILCKNNVKYIGQLDKNKKNDFNAYYKTMEDSNLFIFPTKAECHGIVNCEAAAYALPIFSYDTGGVSTYVINGINGYALPITANAEDFAKQIYECIANGKMQKFSIESRKLYEQRFNWDVWGNKVTDYIKQKSLS